MTWKLTELFFQIRKWIGAKITPEDKTGEMIFAVRIKPVDYEGKSPTQIKIYFDKSLHFEQLQMIGEEVAGTFLALKKIQEKKEALDKAIGEEVEKREMARQK